jgi:hypothetical protein
MMMTTTNNHLANVIVAQTFERAGVGACPSPARTHRVHPAC